MTSQTFASYKSSSIHNPSEEQIVCAALGLTPTIKDDDPLPNDDLLFAPNTSTYRVTNDGHGTNVFLYGTSIERLSVCVRVENFRPYVCVELSDVEKMTGGNADLFQTLVVQLVEELQARLLVISAFNVNDWAPERQAFRSSLSGTYAEEGLQCCIQAPKKNCMPIVAWDIINGRSMRGTGPKSGYRGTAGQRYLRLYTYSPNLVPIIRDLLRGKHADLGLFEQLKKLSVGRRHEKTADELSNAIDERATRLGARPKTKLDKLAAELHARIAAWGAQALYNNSVQIRDPKMIEAAATIDVDNDDGEEAKENDDIFESDNEDEDLKALETERQELLQQLEIDEIGEFHLYAHDNDNAEAREERTDQRVKRVVAAIAPNEAPDDEATEEDDCSGAAVMREEVLAAIAMPQHNAEEDSSEDSEVRGSRVVYYVRTDANTEALRTRLEFRFIRQALRVLYACKQKYAGRGGNSMIDKINYDIYDGDMDFVLRMMIDSRVKIEQWIKVREDDELMHMPDGTLLQEPLRPLRAKDKARDTRQQIELHCDYRFLRYDPNDAVQTKLPQHTHISADCEMRPGPKMEFPLAKQDPVLTTVFIVKDWRELPSREKPPPGKFYYRSVSFSLGALQCNNELREWCSDRFVFSFDTERRMYEAKAKFIATLNPQIVSGYNTDNFDLPYLLERSAVVGAGKVFADAWGKTRINPRMTMRSRMFESTAVGKIVFKDIQAPGMEPMDLFLKIKKDPMFKERDMSLNGIAAKYIDEQKDDVAYSEIRGLQESAAGREKLRLYCEKDALLPLEIMEALRMIPGMIEMARLCGISLTAQVKRGMQIRSKCALASKGLDTVPRSMFYTRTDAEREASADDSYTGATVIEPKIGLYDDMVDTLDFEGLYPAIMRVWNLCYSTRVAPDYDLTRDPTVMKCDDPVNMLSLEERQRRADDSVYIINEVVPNVKPVQERPFLNKEGEKVRVLKHEFCVGIIPLALHEYAAARKRAKALKKEAEKAGNWQLAEIYDIQQNAIKLLMNSMYGYLGAPSSGSFTPDMAAAVTCLGRLLLELTAEKVVEHFDAVLRQRDEAADGKNHANDKYVDIIYGDTDSVFVLLLRCKDEKVAAALGVEMAAFMTDYLKKRYLRVDPRWNVLVLAFEKTLKRLLLLAKKKYAYLRIDYAADGTLKPNPGDGIPSLSGLDGKRRDQTLLIADNFMDMVATLLDYHHSAEENVKRLRKLVWERMVHPVLNKTVNLRYLACTKQVRKSASQYTVNSAGHAMSAPVHVQLFEKLVQRAGGSDAAGAPQVGERINYVIVKGLMGDKVSSRAEDPVHVLDNNLQIDSRYYLDKHIKPSVLRLVSVVLCKDRTKVGRTDAQKLREQKNYASKIMFGHMSDYNYCFEAVDKQIGDVVPATMVARMKKDAAKATGRVSKKMLPSHDPLTGEALRRPRLRNTEIETQSEPVPLPPVKSKDAPTPKKKKTGLLSAPRPHQQKIDHYSVVGVACKICGQMCVGRTAGYICQPCAAKHPHIVEKVLDDASQILDDIEELYRERSVLVDRCNDCVGCGNRPKAITCRNTSCPTFWDRQLNLRSKQEAYRRLKVYREVIGNSGIVPAIDFSQECYSEYEDAQQQQREQDDDDDASNSMVVLHHQKKRKQVKV